MTASDSNNRSSGGRKSLRVAGVIVVLVAIGLTVVWLKVVRGGEAAGTEMATFLAKRGPLTISVLESGTIKSREQLIMKNEVEGRTTIISLIPEGTRVKKGALLVELDASTMDDDKIEQEIRTMNAEAAFVNAEQTLAVVKNQAISDVNVAELTLEFAIQDLEQYKIGQYPNDNTAAVNQIEIADFLEGQAQSRRRRPRIRTGKSPVCQQNRFICAHCQSFPQGILCLWRAHRENDNLGPVRLLELLSLLEGILILRIDDARHTFPDERPCLPVKLDLIRVRNLLD